MAAAADYFFDRRWKADTCLVPARRHPHRADQGQPPLRRPGRRPARPTDGTWSSSPRAVAPPTAGPRSSAAVPPTWRRARGGRSSPSTSTAPGTSCRRAAARCGAPGPRSPSARRCGRPRARTPAGFGVRIEAAVATLADESTTDWWTAREQAAGRDDAGPRRVPTWVAWRRSWALDPAPDRSEADRRRGQRLAAAVEGLTPAQPGRRRRADHTPVHPDTLPRVRWHPVKSGSRRCSPGWRRCTSPTR